MTEDNRSVCVKTIRTDVKVENDENTYRILEGSVDGEFCVRWARVTKCGVKKTCSGIVSYVSIPKTIEYGEEKLLVVGIEKAAGVGLDFEFLDIPEDSALQYIGENAFNHSTISCVRLPDSIKKIGAGAFGWCDKLSTVSLPIHLMHTCDINAVFEGQPCKFSTSDISWKKDEPAKTKTKAKTIKNTKLR